MPDKNSLSGRKIGEFVFRERLDAGGFGTVYRCEQPTLGREAVVKVLHHRLRGDDVQIQRFLREAQLASRLDHPYAAHVYAFGAEETDGLLWIAMLGEPVMNHPAGEALIHTYDRYCKRAV
jgi:serine/threonine-protein kinase